MRGLVRGWMFAAVLAGCGRVGFEHLAGDGDTMTSDAGKGRDAPAACATMTCSGRSAIITCGTRCFSVCDDDVDQPVAKARCAAWGGALLSIHSAAEQACIESMLEADATWIGYEQGASDAIAANWAWNDGTPNTFAPRWSTNEPNDGDGTENGSEQCSDLFTNGAWNDDDCSQLRSISCAR